MTTNITIQSVAGTPLVAELIDYADRLGADQIVCSVPVSI